MVLPLQMTTPNSAAQSRDTSQFPLLVSHMTQRTEMEGVMVTVENPQNNHETKPWFYLVDDNTNSAVQSRT